MTVPPEGANVNGAEFIAGVALAAGVATSDVNITGFALTVTASLEVGAVGGDVEIVTNAPGAELTVLITLQSGAGSTDAPVIELDGFGLTRLTEDDLLDLGG